MMQIGDQQKHDGATKHVQVRIGGMTCNHCKMTVEEALLAVPGVVDATVNLDRQAAEVTASSNVVDLALIRAVEGAGYTVKGIS